MVSNTLKLKVSRLNLNILTKLLMVLVLIKPLETSKLEAIKMLVDGSVPLVLTLKLLLLSDQYPLLLMLKNGQVIPEVSMMIVEPLLTTEFWLLDILMIIGSLKILGEVLGVKKDILD